MELFSIITCLLQNTSPKLKLFVKGRKNIWNGLEQFKNDSNSPIAWFHVASLGEYEQAKPVINQLKKREPEQRIIVSFFSPSGYENSQKKKQENVDFITYLPIDTARNARKFLEILQPKMAFFVKYDLWANYILEAKKQNIHLYLFSAAMREDQVYFQPFGGFFRKVLKSFDHIFTQNERSLDLLLQINIKNSSLAGDTRFDRVSQIKSEPVDYKQIKILIENQKTIVIGSAWQKDMDLLIPFINQSKDFVFIIAPHDIHESTMAEWEGKIDKSTVRFSEITTTESAEVIIIDNIGMLSSLYQYAYIAYVGGAFGKGLHNILEPLAFGIPVIFGKLKKAKKFPEAKISIDYGASCSVANFEELKSIINELKDPELYQEACNAANKLVKENLGGAEKIVNLVMSKNQN
ncbi:3-deoxy-D-manno-octulosonic-acid transferase [Belliella baltica DSM 15883]|uniref:3-deoxy-D-manno-octulosonic acid transferase n=2 Tax=Belliella TaxID=232244 RepID=I3Z4N6_BELBD|nr:3-deoxy-D-manno-octulosonic-acid transferase [Belliella baltica DSM 15883]